MTYELARALLFTEALDSPALGGALLHAARDRTSLVRALAAHVLLPGEELDAELGGSGRKGGEDLSPSRKLMASLPPGLCAQLVAVPLVDLGSAIEVAVADVRDRHVAEELSYWLGKEVRLVPASIAAIDAAIEAARDPSARRSARPGSSRPASARPASRREARPRLRPARGTRIERATPRRPPRCRSFPTRRTSTTSPVRAARRCAPTSQTPAWGTVVELAVSAGAVVSDRAASRRSGRRAAGRVRRGLAPSRHAPSAGRARAALLLAPAGDAADALPLVHPAADAERGAGGHP